MKKDKITGNGYTMENQSFKQLTQDTRCQVENILQLLKSCKVQLI